MNSSIHLLLLEHLVAQLLPHEQVHVVLVELDRVHPERTFAGHDFLDVTG